MKLNLMVVGTASGVGKSTLVAGLCRLFAKKNIKVCPFKSQNMSLNSFVTKDGKEMGRAQVVQAHACYLEPQVEMNPILLKPSGNNKIQVIIKGKAEYNMSGIEYNNFKENLIPVLRDIYKELEEKFDMILIEGAGSPVEINIKQKDISNLEMARIADAPILLVADIDRGGVFASIYGTIMLMSEADRKRVIGIVINKFRGNAEILKAGFDEIYKLTGKKILGVLPYLDIDIEDEDSISDKYKNIIARDKKIKISVIKLRHISNSTDINPFSMYEDVEINFVDRAEALEGSDMIIIPGSKNTIDDMKFLIERALDKKIKEEQEKGHLIFGICGGMQILGREIFDNDFIEGEESSIEGLALLPYTTTMEKDKKTIQYSGLIKAEEGFLKALTGKEISGYEIHQGISVDDDEEILNLTEDKRLILVAKHNIVGTYLHGIFDNKFFTDYVLTMLRDKKGLTSEENSLSYQEYKEKQFDILEKHLKENIDIDSLFEEMKKFKAGV